MTTDIELYRPDTGEFPPVRVVDGHTPTRADGKPTHMDLWDAIERRAADEFAAWLEGRTAQAVAEMRALCDELGLPPAPVTWAEVGEVHELPGAVALANEAYDRVQAYFDADDPDERPGRAVPDRYDPALAAQARAALTEQARRQGWTPDRGDYGPHPTPTGPPSENPYCMRCGKHLGKPFHETNEHDEAAKRAEED